MCVGINLKIYIIFFRFFSIMLYYQLGFYFVQVKYIESYIIKNKSYYMKDKKKISKSTVF